MRKIILKSITKPLCDNRETHHVTLTLPIVATVLAIGTGLAHAQQSDSNTNNAVPARAATLATSQAITNVIVQNPFSGSGAFRFRFGEKSNPHEGFGMAAGDGSNWSIWATPVVSTFKNNIAPYTSTGKVALALAGIEYNHNDVMITGVSLALDSTNSDTNYNGGTYKSTGTTLSPYLVYQINNAWMTDWSLGFGSSKPTTSSSSYGTGNTSSDRFFAAAGLSNRTELGRSFVLSPRISYTYYRDYLAGYTSSNNTVNNPLTSYLYQTKLGATLAYEKPGFSPFITVSQIFNNQTYSIGGQTPSVYASTYQAITGINISKGMFYGTAAYQMERDTSQFRIYGGIRF